MYPPSPAPRRNKRKRESLAGVPCAYCGAPATTRDHILPRSRGSIPYGMARNLRPACEPCNQRRARFWHCPAMFGCLAAIHARTGESDTALIRRLHLPQHSNGDSA